MAYVDVGGAWMSLDINCSGEEYRRVVRAVRLAAEAEPDEHERAALAQLLAELCDHPAKNARMS